MASRRRAWAGCSPKPNAAAPDAGPVVVIGEEIWKNQFDSDPNIVGRKVRINRAPFTVAGVLPAGFSGRIRGPGIWIPWTMQRLFYQNNDLFHMDSTPWLTVEGRLKPGRTRAQAQSELAVIAAQLDRLEPGRQTAMHLTNGSFGEEPALRANLFWISPLVMGALTLILLIACTNVTVLQLSRAVTRQREMGIRLSIGAGRSRLMRMLLTEILLLATLAGALSAYIAFQAPAIFTKMLATSSMPVYQTKPDLHVMIYLGAIILCATIMAGLSPAGESLRVDLHSAMKARKWRYGGRREHAAQLSDWRPGCDESGASGLRRTVHSRPVHDVHRRSRIRSAASPVRLRYRCRLRPPRTGF